MFEWLTNEENDAIAMLKRDHDKVKALFDQFEKAERKAEKQKIVKQALEELRIHSTLEEEIFYPAVREQLKNGIMIEADEEHHVAKVLIAELDTIESDNDHFDAKFTVLAESVRHHIKEEEDEMLPKARDLKIDFQALGEKMERRKAELKAKGLPPTAEDAMIRKTHGRADFPARAAQRKKSPSVANSAGSVAKKRVVVKRSANSRRG
jgi:Hemerythrin HHE cation binding domain